MREKDSYPNTSSRRHRRTTERFNYVKQIGGDVFSHRGSLDPQLHRAALLTSLTFHACITCVM